MESSNCRFFHQIRTGRFCFLQRSCVKSGTIRILLWNNLLLGDNWGEAKYKVL